ncbi:cytochrome P450 [Leifsonia sp. Root112D2]|uniref:cytochrome P450 n=1 Tax=Leifsonia sp. Root112D2 TaxID=1736426 RepID=UPI0006FD6C87|nr:cytochrome P450 [Leifsonia sp. Root112D2]KQV06679.1 cytochrome [Leifsonia sp. Root112D2]
MATTPVTADIDLFADDIVIDPYPTFTELRDLGAVVHVPANDVYALTRYDTIREALGDPGTFSSVKAIGFNPGVNEALQGTSLASDPPTHTQLRATLSANLTPRALRGLEVQINEKADVLVAQLAEGGDFEAIDALARAFPLEIVADLIGFTGQVKANMLRWGQAAMQVIGPMNQRTMESFEIAGELYGWCNTVTADDLADGSIGRGIFDAQSRGEIPEGFAGNIIHQYLGAGVDTTIAAIGNIVALFGRHPEQFELVRQDASLVPAAFAEVLRYWIPIHAWGRKTTRDVEIDGAVVPAGAQIAILFGAGNRDERHYVDADSFQIQRNPVDHLSFGYGPHGCAGQGLARMEGHAVIKALANHVRSFRLGDELRVPSNITRSIEKLDVLDVVPA